MFIREAYVNNSPVISFEISPPRTADAVQAVSNLVASLKKLNPAFVSVTYGAGGSTRDQTVEIASKIKNHFEVEVLAHQTCICHTAEEIDSIVARLQAEGIENILALRGDPPAGVEDFDYSSCTFKYAIDIVKHLRSRVNVCVGGAAYPEGHIASPRITADLANLKHKVDAGIDFLITQLFFDNRVLYDFLERARGIGVTCPVSAGILPVASISQINHITKLCGVSIPAKLWLILEKYSGSPEDLQKAGIEYASTQVQDLLANGVDGIHLYTFNKVGVAESILGNVGLV